MKRLLGKFSVLINADLSIGLIRSKNFRNIYKNYLGSKGDQDSADTSFDELSRRNFAPGPVKHVYVEEKKIRHHQPHHKRHHQYRRKHSKNYIYYNDYYYYYYYYYYCHHHHHYCVNDKMLKFDWFSTAHIAQFGYCNTYKCPIRPVRGGAWNWTGHVGQLNSQSASSSKCY